MVSRWQMAAFIAVMLLVWGLFAGTIAMRMVLPARLTGPSSTFAWCAVAASWLFLPAMFILRMVYPEFRGTHPLEWAAYLSFAVVTMLVPLILVRDAGWVLARVLHFLPADLAARGRLFNWTSVGLVVLLVPMLSVGIWENARPPRVETVDLPIKGLPRALEGYRMVQLTDMHLGATLHRDRVVGMVEIANGLDPDAVFLTGDLADGIARVLRPDAAPLGDLRARDGKFFVTGNHEYYSDFAGWMGEIPRLGFAILDNSRRVITRGDARLVIAGIPDSSVRRTGYVPGLAPSDPALALAGVPRDAVKILLSHQPGMAPRSARAGATVQISGHTHGGQYFPWNFVLPLVIPYGRSGLSRVDGMLLYVSRGTSSWGPPVRLGVPAEITLFRLTRG